MTTTILPGKKKFFIDILMFAVIIIGIFLSGCPDTKKPSTAEAAAFDQQRGPVRVKPDSASLIHHLAFLASDATAGRLTASPGNLLAQRYIIRKFDSLGLSKTGESWLQPFPFGSAGEGQTGNNVIGLIKGEKYPDSVIAITAHYDHLGAKDGKIYYGADDNASGTASLLVMAQYFKQHPPQHSILFVAFDAEEEGLIGSRYFVLHSPVPISKIILNLNMDMVSRNDKNEIYACGIHYYPFLKKYVDSIQPITPVHIMFGHDLTSGGSENWVNQSDHYPFYKNNIPFIYFGVEDHEDYHKPGDTFEKVNKRFYYQVVSMITSTAVLLDRQEKLQ